MTAPPPTDALSPLSTHLSNAINFFKIDPTETTFRTVLHDILSTPALITHSPSLIDTFLLATPPAFFPLIPPLLTPDILSDHLVSLSLKLLRLDADKNLTIQLDIVKYLMPLLIDDTSLFRGLHLPLKPETQSFLLSAITDLVPLFRILLTCNPSSFSASTTTAITQTLSQTTSPIIAQLGCSLLKKTSLALQTFLSLISSHPFVAPFAAQTLFSICDDPLPSSFFSAQPLAVINNSFLGIPLTTPAAKDTILHLFSTRVSSMTDKITISFSISQFPDFIFFRSITATAAKHSSFPPPTLLSHLLDQINPNEMHFNQLVDNFIWIAQQIVPSSLQLHPHQLHLFVHTSLHSFPASNTVDEVVQQLGSHHSLCVFGQHVDPQTLLLDLGLHHGDSLCLLPAEHHPSSSPHPHHDASSYRPLLLRLLASPHPRTFDMLQVLPFLPLSHHSYQPYALLEASQDVLDIDAFIACIQNVDCHDPVIARVLCLILLRSSHHMAHAIVTHLFSTVSPPSHLLPFLTQILLCPSLHALLTTEMKAILFQFTPQIIQSSPEARFCLALLFKTDARFAQLAVNIRDTILLSHIHRLILMDNQLTPATSASLTYSFLDIIQGIFLEEHNTTTLPVTKVSTVDEFRALLGVCSSHRQSWYVLSLLSHSIPYTSILPALPITGPLKFHHTRGLHNSTKTLCYMISVLILLFNVDEFRAGVLASTSTNNVVVALQKIFEYLLGRRPSHNLLDLIATFAPSPMEFKMFNDVHEFMMVFWDILEQNMDAKEYANLVNHFLFRRACPNPTTPFESHIAAIVPYGYDSLEDFIAVESAWFQAIETVPQYFQVVLQRSVVSESFSPLKNNKKISFGYSLDVPYALGVGHYELKGVIVHVGTTGIGHYKAYVRRCIDTDEWVCYDDDVITTTEWNAFNLPATCFGKDDAVTENAYILLYQKSSSTAPPALQTLMALSDSLILADEPCQLSQSFLSTLLLFPFSSPPPPFIAPILHILPSTCSFNLSLSPFIPTLLDYLLSPTPIVSSFIASLFSTSHSLSLPPPYFSAILSFLDTLKLTRVSQQSLLVFVSYLSSLFSLHSQQTALLFEQLFFPLVLYLQDKKPHSTPQIKDLFENITAITTDPRLKTHLLPIISSNSDAFPIVQFFNGDLPQVAVFLKSLTEPFPHFFMQAAQTIFASQDKKAICLLLSIYSSNDVSISHQQLPPEACNGLLTRIKPTEQWMLLLDVLLNNNPVVDECLDAMFDARNAIKRVVKAFFESIAGRPASRLEDLQATAEASAFSSLFPRVVRL